MKEVVLRRVVRFGAVGVCAAAGLAAALMYGGGEIGAALTLGGSTPGVLSGPVSVPVNTIALPDCAGHPKVKPKQVVFACGDGNFGFDRLSWIGWGGARAVGLASAYINDCKPYCAAGHFHRYPAVLIASGSQRCPDGERAYLTVAYAFIGRSPFPQGASGTWHPRQAFRCIHAP